MAEHHPDLETLERFSRDELDPAAGAWIVEHLRSGCAVCQCSVDQILAELTPAPPVPDLEEEGAWKRLLSDLEHRMDQICLERESAPALVAELLERPAAERDDLARSRRRFRTLAVCEALIEKSFEEGFQNPARSLELAELAVRMSDDLPPDRYGRAVVQDLRARAWAFLGNARRISSDLPGAEQALGRAEILAEEGSADPLEEARILDLRASLLSDQGRFEQAAELLDVVIDIYEEINDPQRMGRALISQGLFLVYAGQPARSIELLRQGLGLIDGEKERRLALMARHNLAWALNDGGRPEEAQAHLESFRHVYGEFRDAWTELRLAWLEGRIAAGLGRLSEAGRRLREVRRGFAAQGLSYDACMVTLDLAALYLQEGRPAEVRRLVSEMLPIFVSQEVHRQALAALAAFRQAVDAERATPALAREVFSYLQRARRNPGLRFAPSAR